MVSLLGECHDLASAPPPLADMSGPIDDSALRAFITERNLALIALDENYVARMVPKAPPEMRLLILHKSRYECTAMPANLRNESRAWLAERGYGRMTGDPLLPEGQLPE